MRGLACLENGKFINYTTRNGLSSNLILSLYEDRDMTLWIVIRTPAAGTTGGSPG